MAAPFVAGRKGKLRPLPVSSVEVRSSTMEEVDDVAGGSGAGGRGSPFGRGIDARGLISLYVENTSLEQIFT